ncbi:MAG: RNA polymerase sigma factor [Bacteroidales bacterium]
MTEQEMIRGILEGDEHSFRVMVEIYQEMVFRTCMGILHNREDADDIAQEVFIEIYTSLVNFRSQSKLSTWVYRIAVNKSLNHLKRLRRKKLFTRIEDLVTGRSGGQMPEPAADASDKGLVDQERTDILQLALNSLPENQRVAFVLFRYDDLSQKEIAEQMELTVPAVESLIHRAKQALQKKLLAYHKNLL